MSNARRSQTIHHMSLSSVGIDSPRLAELDPFTCAVLAFGVGRLTGTPIQEEGTMTTATIRENVRGLRPVDAHEREMQRDVGAPPPRFAWTMMVACLAVCGGMLGVSLIAWWAAYELLWLVWR